MTSSGRRGRAKRLHGQSKAVLFTDWHRNLSQEEAKKFIFDITHNHYSLVVTADVIRIKLLNNQVLTSADREFLETLLYCLLMVGKRRPGRPRRRDKNMPASYTAKLARQRRQYDDRKKP